MTDKQKFKAIVERLNAEGWCDDSNYISLIMIVHYLDQLQSYGLVTCAFNMTDSGRKVAAICEEFDWRPSDEDIVKFVSEMVEDDSKDGFLFMIKRYRDNREKLLEEVKKFKESNGEI